MGSLLRISEYLRFEFSDCSSHGKSLYIYDQADVTFNRLSSKRLQRSPLRNTSVTSNLQEWIPQGPTCHLLPMSRSVGQCWHVHVLADIGDIPQFPMCP